MEPEPREPFVELTQAVWRRWPGHPPYGGAHREIVPHLTLAVGAEDAARRGLEVHAGQGLDYETVTAIAAIPQIAELNIGHFLIGEAIFADLEKRLQQHVGTRVRIVGKADAGKVEIEYFSPEELDRMPA